jgi:Mg-chelatase subunit ChlD
MPRVWRAFQVTAAALLLGVLAVLPALAAKEAASTDLAPGPAAVPVATAQSNCGAEISRTIVPDVIRSCERSSVRLRVRPYCPGDPINFVLVLWGYAHPQLFAPLYERWTTAAVDALQMSTHPNVRVGIVYGWGTGSILLKLTNDEDQVRGLSRIRYRYDYEWEHFCINCCYVKAAQTLADSRPGDRNVMVSIMGWDWMTYSPWQEDWAEAARTGKKAADTFMMGCPWRGQFARGCRVDLGGEQSNWYRQASPGYYFENGDKLAVAIEELVRKTTRGELASVSVEDEWPAGVDVVPGSVVPPPALIDPPNRRLRWDIAAPITRPITLTYEVAPLAEGTHSFTGGRLVLTDTAKLTRLVSAPTGVLTVTGACVTPTFTPPPTSTATDTAKPGPTASRTAVATPSPTSTVTATPTAVPEALYLPVALREKCLPGQKRIDVVLAIDASRSMVRERTTSGGTKLDAAIDATRQFLDLLHLRSGDQAAIVVFNDGAAVLVRLTSDRAALDAALGAISTAEHTCLPCAVDVAATELAGERHRPANTPSLILLTDGKSNPRPASEAVARADEAKRAGIVIFTIGLGSDLDDAALAAIASQPAFYYRAPTAEQLGGIYHQIAVAIPCPADRFWRRR